MINEVRYWLAPPALSDTEDGSSWIFTRSPFCPASATPVDHLFGHRQAGKTPTRSPQPILSLLNSDRAVKLLYDRASFATAARGKRVGNPSMTSKEHERLAQ